MSPSSAEVLRQANDYIQAGQPQLAQPLLVALIRQSPASDQAWYLLSLVVSDMRQQIDCLERALKINPANVSAQARLAQLLEPAPKASTSPAWLAALQSARHEEPPVREPPRARPSLRMEPAPRVEPAPPPPEPVVVPLAPREPVTSPEAQLRTSEIASEAAPRKKRRLFGKRSATLEETSAQKSKAVAQRASAASQTARRPCSKRRLILAVGLLLVVVVIIGGVAAITLSARQPAAPQVAVLLPTSTGTPTATPSLTPTPPILTWTPTPTLIPEPTHTPTELPTVNPTLAAQMSDIQGQVGALRGLSLKAVIQRIQVPPENLERMLKAKLIPLGYLSDLADQVRSLSALGLITPTYDLTKFMLNRLIDPAGGLYLPWLKQVLMIGSSFRGLGRMTFAGAFDQALVVQNYKIDQLGIYPQCAGDAQRCAAIRALIEGDAALLRAQWTAQSSPQDQVDIRQFTPVTLTLPEASPPAYIASELGFASGPGQAFVQYLYDHGKWAAVNRAFTLLPQSTEQILHPEKYLAGEKPIVVPATPLTDTLGEGWQLIDSNTLGEWTTYLILSSGVETITRLPDNVALGAAQGWGGDHYQVYFNAAISQTVLAAQWTWDTPDDAAEFKAAMSTYLDLRFAGTKSDRSGNPCQTTNLLATCLFTSGQKTLWLLAPDPDLLNQVQADFAGFKDIQ